MGTSVKASESVLMAAERTPPKSRVYPESLASSPAVFDAHVVCANVAIQGISQLSVATPPSKTAQVSAMQDDRLSSAFEHSPGECLRRARDRLKELRRGLKHTMSAPTLSVPPLPEGKSLSG